MYTLKLVLRILYFSCFACFIACWIFNKSHIATYFIIAAIVFAVVHVAIEIPKIYNRLKSV